MLRICCTILGLAVVLAAANYAGLRPGDEAEPKSPREAESLKSALDAVTRKQRSLDYIPQDYYNELRSFKYHPGDGQDEKFDRDRQNNQDLDDDDEDLEFLPLDNGQLENIGGGYQNFNSKRLERALIDYLENAPGQRETVSSPFRERERSGGHKRAITNDRASTNDGDKELAALFYKELQNSPSYNTMGDVDSQDYMLPESVHSVRYRPVQNKVDINKLYDNLSGPMTWGEIFGKQEAAMSRNAQKNDELDSDDDEFGEREQETMYLVPAERRNVNGRYPLGREYGTLLKRFPLTKRSPKPMHTPLPASGVGFMTDDKVAKDLGPLFGGKGSDAKTNRTRDHRDKVEHAVHERNDRHEAVSPRNEHAHEHASPVDEHNDHEGHATVSGDQGPEATTPSEPPSSSLSSPRTTPGQKEITSANNKSGKTWTKRDHRAIEVKKKSVDWSQYFGIDRRKKKAALLARPGSQDQDDEWMIQRYYKTMADNLKSSGKNVNPEKDNSPKMDKLDQMDTRLKNVKNLIVEDALKYGSDDNNDGQEVNDVVLARLAAAYSLEKMRRALDEFRNTIAAQRELMRAAHAKNGTTTNYRDESGGNNGNQKKRNGNLILDDGANSYEGVDEGRGCPELENIERSCRPAKAVFSGLYEPCVMHQICRACGEERCFNIFLTDAARVCENIPDSRELWGHCARTALVINQMQPSPIATALCGASVDSCLRRQYRYRHRALDYQNGWLPHLSMNAEELRER